MSEPLSVQIWSDVQCPWCYIGKRKFEAALAELAAERLGFRATADFETELAVLADWVAQQTADDRVSQARAELEKRGLVA